MEVTKCSLVNEFFLASNCEIASERARRCGLAPLPHPVGCRWQWYISNLLFHGDSSKTLPPTWRARHHVPPELTAMHALYVCAHGGSKLIYTGVGKMFSCDPHPCFDLGKLFIQLQGVTEWVNLKVFTIFFAVSDDAQRNPCECSAKA